MFPDVFAPDLFTTTALTAAIDKIPYVPGIISQLGIFEEDGVAVNTIVIEKEGHTLHLVPTAQRGASGLVTGDNKRKGFAFEIPHLPERDALLVGSIQGVRAMGTTDQLVTVESARDKKLLKMARNLDLTLEYHRMGAIQGKVYDADGATVLFDLFTILGSAEPTEVDFDLDNASPASGALRTKCNGVVRAMEDALDGLPFTGIHALVGNTFWDQLTAHKEVVETYLHWQAAAELRGSWLNDVFHFGGINWQRYRGRGSVAVGATKARFFPTGVPGLFQTAFGPADYVETVNTNGIAKYAKAEPMEFGKGVKFEAQSNPLNICTMPEVLLSARNT